MRPALIPVQSVLVEFDRGQPAAWPEAGGREDAAGESHSPLLGPSPRELSIAEEAGYARGRAEALAAALAEADLRVEAAREEERRRAQDALAEALAAARTEWAENEGATLVRAVTDGLAALEANLAAKTARALRPFLRDAVREKAVAALCDTLADLLRSGPSAALKMSGPEDLLDAAMRRMRGFEGKIAISVTDAPDIRVVCHETTIETQIAAWARALATADE